MKNQLWILLFIAFIPCTGLSQPYTEIFDEIWGMGENYSVPTVTDIDKDGLLDLIVGNQNGRLWHYRQKNPQSTDFTLITDDFNDIDCGEFTTPCFVDIDNDGLLDWFVGRQRGVLSHFEQETVTSFRFNHITEKFNDIKVRYGSVPVFTDLDHDDLLDMIVAERAGNLNYYEQVSIHSEHFTLVDDSLGGIVAQHRPRPFFIDLDKDDLLDLIIGGIAGELQHYEQNENGSLEFVMVAENFSNIDVGFYSAPWFGDLNNDDIIDLIIGEERGYLYHYIQDGNDPYKFNLVTEKFVNRVIDAGINAAPAMADLDGDGLIDMLIGEEEGTLHHYEQSAAGSSVFISITGDVGIDVGLDAAPVLTHLNDNGLYDLVIGNRSGNLYCYEQESSGSTVFQFITDTLGGIDVGANAAPCILDLDDDGLMDLIVGESDGYLRHYEQESAGSTDFVWLSDSLGGINSGTRAGPAFTDLDDDGLWDVIVGNRGVRVHHYEQDINDSTYHLITDLFNDVYIPTAKPVFLDVNGDGLEDYLAGTYWGDVRYFQRMDETLVEEHHLVSYPQAITLYQNYPNPFNLSTTICFQVDKRCDVRINIFNTFGQHIKSLSNKSYSPGDYTILWDSSDETGTFVASGVYLCRIEANGFYRTNKVLLIR